MKHGKLARLAVLVALVGVLAAFAGPRFICPHRYGLPPTGPGLYQPLAVGMGVSHRLFCPPGHQR